MIKQKIIFSLILTLMLTVGYAQESVNQFDKDSLRHGYWTKNYPDTELKRYEGVFEHGKEIDTFKYYKVKNEKSVLSAVRVFNKKDRLSEVTFFASNKTIVSKGKMNGKRFIGKWLYYHKNSNKTMIIEHYNAQGELEGKRSVFYKNGSVAEVTDYLKDKKHGEANWYSEQNKLIKSTNYKNDELNGKAKYYDIYGNIEAEGAYKDDKKRGLWIYYKEGKERKRVNHTTQTVISKS